MKAYGSLKQNILPQSSAVYKNCSPPLAAKDIHLCASLVSNTHICTHSFQTRKSVQREVLQDMTIVCHHLTKSTNNLNEAKRARTHTHAVLINSSLNVKTNYPRQEIRYV